MARLVAGGDAGTVGGVVKVRAGVSKAPRPAIARDMTSGGQAYGSWRSGGSGVARNHLSSMLKATLGMDSAPNGNPLR
jgi:hypothetical protein